MVKKRAIPEGTLAIRHLAKARTSRSRHLGIDATSHLEEALPVENRAVLDHERRVLNLRLQQRVRPAQSLVIAGLDHQILVDRVEPTADVVSEDVRLLVQQPKQLRVAHLERKVLPPQTRQLAVHPLRLFGGDPDVLGAGLNLPVEAVNPVDNRLLVRLKHQDARRTDHEVRLPQSAVREANPALAIHRLDPGDRIEAAGIARAARDELPIRLRQVIYQRWQPLGLQLFRLRAAPENTVARIHQRTSKKTQMKSASFTNVDPTTQNNPMTDTR